MGIDWFGLFIGFVLIGAFTYGAYTMHQQDKKFKEKTGDNW